MGRLDEASSSYRFVINNFDQKDPFMEPVRQAYGVMLQQRSAKEFDDGRSDIQVVYGQRFINADVPL